jgi:hypothetical protein
MICRVAAARGGIGGGRDLQHAVKATNHVAVAAMVSDYATVVGGRVSFYTMERGRQDVSHGGKKVPRTILLLLLSYGWKQYQATPF